LPVACCFPLINIAFVNTNRPASLVINGRSFEWGTRTYVMGVVNLSPDSFAGDGLADAGAAVEQAKRFEAEGADIVDVGGQSTRPDFKEISVADEIERTEPAVRAIADAINLPVSIDTYRAEVASVALEAGAHLVNDIWGFRKDPAMARLVAGWEVPAVIMHNQRGRPVDDVIAAISDGFNESIALASDAGVAREKLIIDPGFGFGWTVEQNLELLRRLDELAGFGLPVLVGTSRKSTIGAILDRPVEDRLWGTAATVALAIAAGADIVRVHDVAEMVQVTRMADAIVRRR
jgi:dihydropteroate synthase